MAASAGDGSAKCASTAAVVVAAAVVADAVATSTAAHRRRETIQSQPAPSTENHVAMSIDSVRVEYGNIIRRPRISLHAPRQRLRNAIDGGRK